MNSLKFEALVIETIDRCNAQCAMCYQAAGPKGSDLRGDSNLPPEVAFRVIEQAAQLPELGSRLHISGGEAFIRYRDVLAMYECGRRAGFANIGSTTNAVWAVTREVALERCLELSDAGGNYFEVSTDFWHLPYVSMDRVRNLVWAARQAGTAVFLRTLSTKKHRMDEIMANFAAEELLNVVIVNCPVYPVGRAASQIPADEIYPGGGPNGCCETLLNLTIAPNGNVYPCCAGADMTDSLACGNVHKDSLAQAVFKMRTDRMIRRIVHSGSSTMIPIIQKLGYADRLQPRYTNMCHLCWDVFKDDEVANALRVHFQEEQIQEMISFLEGSSSLTCDVRKQVS